MYEEQQNIIFDIIKRLAIEDAKFIDTVAKTLDINQKHIYSMFIEYHKLIYSKMYEKDDHGKQVLCVQDLEALRVRRIQNAQVP